MPGFNVSGNINALYDSVKLHYFKARNEIYEELNSAGYKDIINDVYISEDFQRIEITMKDGFATEKQDVFEVLAQGGTLLKNGEPVAIKPSAVIRKYLGKR